MAKGMIETDKGMIGLLGHLSAESSNFSFTPGHRFGCLVSLAIWNRAISVCVSLTNFMQLQIQIVT